MNEKTTLYIEPELKKKVQVELIKDEDKQSLSNLVNILLGKWIRERELRDKEY
ncbi:hypothetical protein CTDIVETGP_1409 [Clostridium tyrobutyricum DIVETGP]|uniref:Uncharacterized protein n=1 Tax=Clostridium tyrobutyricum DIVETGP TaxID=1408889 RepID=W6N7K5_CLOTY|nr:hypothetical protein [Clostridium tyrobutyricum]AND83525.1 hypothetical protein CTK_C02550 [Clostridium tyrobutyricum]MBV4425745.1 hypothetical protein [Clostridium tyrobutyricum]MBV4433169.1 hypothetical protein [Clostridium tyrobutyricum]CDL91339.1 hypothetical protein CTDIVETGP_1409 [Clostridium tyrobutyricum DIVETGP]